jgi:hypothetical protein
MGKGECVNDQVDWEDVAEEIEDMGNNVVRGVASHLVAPHWRAETRGHRDDAREAYAPSMKDRPELDVSKLYRRALRRMPDTIDGAPPLPVPEGCPVALDELLSDEAAA